MANSACYPALSVPNGFNENGTPTAITFFGRPFGEAELLVVAKAYQDQMKRITEPVARAVQAQYAAYRDLNSRAAEVTKVTRDWDRLVAKSAIPSRVADMAKVAKDWDQLITKSGVPSYVKDSLLIRQHYDLGYNGFREEEKKAAEQK